jgi:uncharacterized protein with HEPN domain
MCETEDIVRLRHMLDAARKAIEFTENCGRIDLDNDKKFTELGESEQKKDSHKES